MNFGKDQGPERKFQIGNRQSEMTFGDEREMESGLTFNQLICEFEPRHPRQDIADFQLPIADCVQGPTSKVEDQNRRLRTEDQSPRPNRKLAIGNTLGAVA
jgi:hypothetical protein